MAGKVWQTSSVVGGDVALHLNAISGTDSGFKLWSVMCCDSPVII